MFQTHIPDFLEDTAGESRVSSLIERFFVIPSDVETRNFASLQTNFAPLATAPVGGSC
ncbi:hypothetical protein [Fischerella sp. PCC 9605]|uniref:hypothetical protein n=1 Tax=Fischerella sp. PCC 9605 TaxID=1173024 RepID=UPI0004BAECE2|nr:hypothetical protein [Fischerella sp. PCC 9605]